LDTSVVSKAKADIINKSPALQIKKDLAFGFERIGGYDALKDHIRKTIIMPLKDPERARSLGMDLPRGMILFGPGGTGKTVITKAIAKEIGMPFVTLNPENFMTSLVGESEKNLRNAFRLMREMSPIICFLDEIDRLGGRGKPGESDGGTSSRIFSMFLDELGDEDRKYFVVGATNMPFLDPAFIRPGRFDTLIPMLSPDLKARKEIFNVHLSVVRKVPNDITPQQIEDLACTMDGWKGNMIEELVKRATRMAFDGGSKYVSLKHMLLAKEDYQVNQKALQDDEAKYIDAAEKLCNSKTFLDAMLKERGVKNENGRRRSLKEVSG
jgi:transitional endoplasmic reticulum ATPase